MSGKICLLRLSLKITCLHNLLSILISYMAVSFISQAFFLMASTKAGLIVVPLKPARSFSLSVKNSFLFGLKIESPSSVPSHMSPCSPLMILDIKFVCSHSGVETSFLYRVYTSETGINCQIPFRSQNPNQIKPSLSQ